MNRADNCGHRHKQFFYVIRGFWILGIMGIALSFVLSWNNFPSPEFGLRMMLQLMLLSAPGCFFVWAILWIVTKIFPILELSPLVGWLTLWAVTAIAGYLQWFTFIPWLLKTGKRLSKRVKGPGNGQQ